MWLRVRGSRETIEQHITGHARQVEAHEYAQARKIAHGDIDGDEITDTAVVYTLEGAHGSNTYEQFLAVSSSRQRSQFFHTVTGGKNVRAVDGVRINRGRVELAVFEYGPSDPSCCPSRRASTGYILKDGALVEVRVR